jgi:hypothetical protein
VNNTKITKTLAKTFYISGFSVKLTHFCVNEMKCKCLNPSVYGIFLSAKFQCGNNVNVFFLSRAYLKNLKFSNNMFS